MDLNDPVTRKIILDNQNLVVPILIRTEESRSKGQYGICIDCGNPIPEERLSLLATEYCVSCQEKNL